MTVVRILNAYRVDPPSKKALALAAIHRGYDEFVNDNGEYAKPVDWSNHTRLGFLEVYAESPFHIERFWCSNHQSPYLEVYLNSEIDEVLFTPYFSAEKQVGNIETLPKSYRVLFFIHWLTQDTVCYYSDTALELPQIQRLPSRMLPYTQYVPNCGLIQAATPVHPVAFQKSQIEFSASIYELGERGDEIVAAVIRLEGYYSYGSLGNGDAAYMAAMRNYVINCVNPSAIVFDLSSLDYKWGNAIWGLFLCDDIPVATVTSKECSGFETCGVAEPTFSSVELAVEHLRPLAKEYDRRLLEE